MRLPETVSIEPDEGFGTLLPEESLERFAIYRPAPKKPGTELPREQNYLTLRLKTGNIAAREVYYTYKANVVQCPLYFSNSKFDFPALPENES